LKDWKENGLPDQPYITTRSKSNNK
jgi:hypothetical protein